MMAGLMPPQPNTTQVFPLGHFAPFLSHTLNEERWCTTEDTRLIDLD